MHSGVIITTLSLTTLSVIELKRRLNDFKVNALDGKLHKSLQNMRLKVSKSCDMGSPKDQPINLTNK